MSNLILEGGLETIYENLQEAIIPDQIYILIDAMNKGLDVGRIFKSLPLNEKFEISKELNCMIELNIDDDAAELYNEIRI